MFLGGNLEGNRIVSFRDLEVYRQSYELMLVVNKDILPKLPKEEKFDLVDQLRRSTKAIPRLIAEGYAKKFQQKGFQKYLYDALAEINETIVGVEQIRDLYGSCVEMARCDEIVTKYDVIARMTYKLMKAWDTFRNPKPDQPN